ncbi:MAG TPA: NUDIX domain-containing protein [Candidatus Saccharimonadales bacterium]|nr:NUDIX domain-containing protein [Candidatus Saccharimonadales bacterium]
MKAHSAGIIVYRFKKGRPEALLAHMGTPWWAKKDIGAWTIPKGLVEEGEEPFEAAKREFQEELSLPVPEGNFIQLGDIEQNNRKIVSAWAVEADPDISNIKSNTTTIEWPPRSGQLQEFPEIDRAAWFGLAEAGQKCVRGQAELFERLAGHLQLPLNNEPTPEPAQGSLF